MSIRTLIVEDDPMVSSINKKFLEKTESFELVGIARNGEDALIFLNNEQIDLLLLDLYMPSLNGMELLRRIRLEDYKCDVIMVTAADSPDIIEEALRLGVIDFILKPYDFGRLQNALQLYKRRNALFRTSGSFSQQEIDSLHSMGGQEGIENLPKGIDALTLAVIREALSGTSVPLSAQDISDLVQLSRITTRKYLEFLVETNEIKLELKYSQQGRPTKLYRYLNEF